MLSKKGLSYKFPPLCTPSRDANRDSGPAAGLHATLPVQNSTVAGRRHGGRPLARAYGVAKGDRFKCAQHFRVLVQKNAHKGL